MESKKKSIVVQYPQPLEEPMSVEEAKGRVGCWMQELVEEGSLSFVAFAEGERITADGTEEEVMYFLIYSHRDYCDRPMYLAYENWSDQFEDAVLTDGRSLHDGHLLDPEDALAQWVAGYAMPPGRYNLRFRLIEG